MGQTPPAQCSAYDCNRTPCRNSGVCRDSRTCVCPTGVYGTNCESLQRPNWIGQWRVATTCNSASCCCFSGPLTVSLGAGGSAMMTASVVGQCSGQTSVSVNLGEVSNSFSSSSSGQFDATLTFNSAILSITDKFNLQCTHEASRVTTSSSDPSASSSSDSSSGPSSPLFIGIIVAVIGIAVFGVFIYIYYRARVQRQQHMDKMGDAELSVIHQRPDSEYPVPANTGIIQPHNPRPPSAPYPSELCDHHPQ